MAKPQATVKVPEPRQSKRRPSAASRVFLWTFLLLLVAGLIGGGVGLYAYRSYMQPGPLAEDKVFIVEQGLSVPQIGDSLEKAGIISNAGIFSAMASVTGTRTRLKAGEYAFTAKSSMQDVMALIASGKSITYKVSIPEGFTSEMAVARVNANEILVGPPATVPPEGSILPDTYVFRRGMTRQKLVDDMRAAQTKLMDELWPQRMPVPLIETKEQAVTLASIVEKETAVATERPMIASVFINRLRKGMRLQSDPTIIYGIAGGKGRLERPLSKADIQAETPYNTYRIKGLPPGPIANPGRAALEAVLNPQTTQYLYFVADGSGGHAFASNLEEHNRNVKKWREIAGNAAAAAAADDPPEAETPAAADAPPASADVPPAAVPPPAALEKAEPPAPAPPPPAEAAAAPAPAADPPKAEAPKPEAPKAEVPKAEAAKPAAAALKPGSVVKVDGELVAIPRQRPKR